MTVFDGREQEAFEQATKLQLTQAIIVSVDEADRNGLYQCRVLPDLLRLEDETGCPWYPLLNKHEKLDAQPGDLVWLYVSEDLGVGYVWCRTNTIADMAEKQSELWTTLQESLEEAEEPTIDLELDYENTFYAQLFDGTFIFFDRDKGTVGVTNGSVTVGLQEGNVFLKGDSEQHGSLTQKGEATTIEAEKEVNVSSGSGTNVASDATTTVDGAAVEINGASKSFVTYSELDSALQSFKASIETAINTAAATAITNHTHISPFLGAPTAPGVGAPIVPPLVLVTAPSQTITVKTGG